jgi:hypothetical protein
MRQRLSNAPVGLVVAIGLVKHRHFAPHGLARRLLLVVLTLASAPAGAEAVSPLSISRAVPRRRRS